MIKTGEMLNMLNLLSLEAPFHPTDLTYLTFPCLKHFSDKKIPLFRESTFTKQGKCKMFFWRMLKTGEMLNMLPLRRKFIPN